MEQDNLPFIHQMELPHLPFIHQMELLYLLFIHEEDLFFPTARLGLSRSQTELVLYPPIGMGIFLKISSA